VITGKHISFLTTWTRRKILPKGKVTEMSKIKKYAFVLDREEIYSEII